MIAPLLPPTKNIQHHINQPLISVRVHNIILGSTHNRLNFSIIGFPTSNRYSFRGSSIYISHHTHFPNPSSPHANSQESACDLFGTYLHASMCKYMATCERESMLYTMNSNPNREFHKEPTSEKSVQFLAIIISKKREKFLRLTKIQREATSKISVHFPVPLYWTYLLVEP